ncbi:pectin lyase fold/virulence factor [Chiua virens]|nr:pectin lyase fold/virulence factor [Chiua virens]
MRFAVVLPLLSLALAASPYVSVDGNTCAVIHIGGGQDDGPNIIDAFDLCKCGGTIVLDRYYVVNTVLVITGLQDVNIQLSGVVQYTPNIAYWSPNAYYMEYQNATTFWFLSGQNIHLYGGGTLDGNGQVWWDYVNKTVELADGSITPFLRPIPLTVGNASNVIVEDLTQIGSPAWNNFVYQSTNVTYRRMNISSASYSSNPAKNSGTFPTESISYPPYARALDGWDIYRSSCVIIEDSTINNDDDCVSFKPNTTDTVVRNLYCNGSHGISVGSLGQYAGVTDIAANIYAKNVSMNNAQNGARIKVFGGSPDPSSTASRGTGYVRNITFEDFYVNNVDHPIYVDSCYSTAADVCAEYPSKVTIADVHYINVTGVSSGKAGAVVVQLECSAECYGITAMGTDLTSPGGDAVYYCENIADESALDFSCTAPPAWSL